MRIRLIGTMAAAVLCLSAGCQQGDQPTLETLESNASQSASTTPTPSPGGATASTQAPDETEPPGSGLATDSGTASASLTEHSHATSPETDGLSEQERADRAAIEAQWIKSWDVYRTLARLPEGERQAVAAAVAVDPALSLMLQDAQSVSEKGWDTYGAIGHRISWPKPVDGATEALISDCQDGSRAGSLDITSGTKKTVGVERALFQGSMRKGDDGVWRLAQSYFLKDEQC